MPKRSLPSTKPRPDAPATTGRIDAPASARTLSSVDESEERRYTPFARMIAEARGLRPQAEIGQASGISRSAISQLERSMRPALEPDDPRIHDLAVALALSPDALREAARRSAPVTRLPGGRVTELHREVGARLEAEWAELSRDVVEQIQRLVEQAPILRGAAPEPSPLGVWLLKKRMDAGLSQEKLATHLGIARSMVSMVETGEHPGLPDPVLKLLAKKFNVRVESLSKLDAGRASYLLPGHGVTDAHRDAALALGARWTRLPKATLEKLLSLIDRARPR